MTGKVKGRGILKHHFWGEYFATIGITFESEADAISARMKLGIPWHQGEKNRKALWTFVGSEGLALVEEQLVKYGADAEKIDSCATSIDYGEPWEIIVPVVAHEQLMLFGD